MIKAFELADGRLHRLQIDLAEKLQAATPIGVDFEAPTLEERRWAKDNFDLVLPDEDDFGDIEESARIFTDATDALHIRSNFLLDKKDASRNVPVAFVIKHHVLFSLHVEDLPVFRLVRMHAPSPARWPTTWTCCSTCTPPTWSTRPMRSKASTRTWIASARTCCGPR